MGAKVRIGSDGGDGAPEEQGTVGLAAMQLQVAREFLLLVTVASSAIAIREVVRDSQAVPAITMTAIGLTALIVAYRTRFTAHLILPVLLALVAVFTRASFGRGGATASALSLAFFPGFLGILALGPGLGWFICFAMFASFAWLSATTPLGSLFDRLRFSNEVAMTLFAAGLAHSLLHSFQAYERAIETRKDTLARLREERRALTVAIYEELEPAARDLVQAGTEMSAKAGTRSVELALHRLIEGLRKAKILARKDGVDRAGPNDPDLTIRLNVVHLWLRLGAVLMAFFVVRNALNQVSFIAPLSALVLCVLIHLWLRTRFAPRHLEATAFAICLLALGPLCAQIQVYGASPSAPALVITPGAVLLVALLSRGPAAFLAVALNGLILLWVGLGKPLSLIEERLLTNLFLSFVIILLVVRRVLTLRTHYAHTLITQEGVLREELAQHRRLAGTLFHDASNNLQAIALSLDLPAIATPILRLRSLTQRVERLIALSKAFLLDPGHEPRLSAFSLGEAFSLVRDSFEAHLDAKRIQLTIESDSGLAQVAHPLAWAEPELLVESVLGNLVSNAIKFSPEGTAVVVSADVVGEEVRIRIRDSGPGLPADVLAQFSGDGVLPTKLGTSGETGQGYGLKLAREHVERMGGSLELSSASGGTECVVRLRSAGSASLTS